MKVKIHFEWDDYDDSLILEGTEEEIREQALKEVKKRNKNYWSQVLEVDEAEAVNGGASQ